MCDCLTGDVMLLSEAPYVFERHVNDDFVNIHNHSLHLHPLHRHFLPSSLLLITHPSSHSSSFYGVLNPPSHRIFSAWKGASSSVEMLCVEWKDELVPHWMSFTCFLFATPESSSSCFRFILSSSSSSSSRNLLIFSTSPYSSICWWR